MACLDAGHGWIRGLKIAALAVVAHAVWTMARKLCPGAVHLTGALISATIVLLAGTALSQVMVIAVAMLLSWAAYKAISKNSTPANPLPADAPDPTNGTRASWLWLALATVRAAAGSRSASPPSGRDATPSLDLRSLDLLLARLVRRN